MKVIHLISGGDVGGAKTHVHTLLKGLCDTDQALLVCFTEGPFAEEAKALGIPTRVLAGKLPQTIRILKKLIPQEGFEIIHCHGSKANMVGAILKRSLDLPTVTTVHSDYRLDYMGRPLANLTYGTINKLALRRLDHWIGVSDVTVDMLLSRGFDPNRTYLIVNGVPFDDETPAMDRETYLKSLGIEPTEQTTVFGIAARINPVKDMETLIRAFAKTVAVCPEARLIIAGDGEQRAQMEALARELCPDGSVTFAGWIQDTHSFYNALDVNMLTSVSEGFPYALPEGARWHCATIASRVGGIPALIDHDYNGYLFTPKDIETLSGYMIRLAQDGALRETFAGRLYEKTKEQFSAQATVTIQREIYAAILEKWRREKSGRRDGIMICGAYGKGNAGDDAILSAMVTSLRREDPYTPICVISRSPKQTRRDVKVGALYTFAALSIRRKLRKTALYLSGGGSLIQNATSNRSLWYYLSSIRSAKRRGNRVMMFSCGIGPVTGELNRALSGRIINRYVDRITLRDAGSLKELADLGVTDVPAKVTADMAFLLDPPQKPLEDAYLKELGIREDGRYLLLAPRPWPEARKHLEDFAAAAEYGYRTYALTPVLMAMEPSRDAPVCQELSGLLGEQIPHLLVNATDDARYTVGLFARMQGVIGMRLHALIFAASRGVPFAGVAYDPKISSFLDHWGQGEYCLLSECSKQRLCRMLDDMLRGSDDFDAAARRLKELARTNCKDAIELMRED